MKSSAKTKEVNNSKKKPANRSSVKKEELSEQDQNILNLWEYEVQSLIDRQFADFEEAIDAVIEGVINKIDPKSSTRQKTRDFLYEFMTSDPEMVSEIKTIFKLT